MFKSILLNSFSPNFRISIRPSLLRIPIIINNNIYNNYNNYNKFLNSSLFHTKISQLSNNELNNSIEDLENDIQIEQLHPALIEKAESLKIELLNLENKISTGYSFNIDENKKYNNLLSFISIYNDFINLNENYTELLKIINNDQEDQILINEAKLEIKIFKKKLINQTMKLKSHLLPQHPFANNSTILELRPGAGGHEANIFTSDLLNMYIKYCQFNNWKYEILSLTNHISGSGIIDATLLINQNGSYNRLRHEAGVHRVQRIPSTETKGRVHTSASGVIVLPKIDEIDNSQNIRKFKPDELRIDVMRASGAGGQHVNTTESAVRIVHLPTGIIVSIQDERSQHKNKEKAFTVLRARLAEKELKEKQEKERSDRTDQVSSVDRSDKIRTYNFQQNRVTDHRCNFTLHDLDGCMQGTKLDLIIDQVEKKEADDKAKNLIKQLESNL
ncbi:hypothetical protein C6P40_003350 [Pichia californica]|uniref:Peptide chain release factor 1, mitochondrial n=1 Tax=Pichia californica TaxID=460514 RepID=A0A9P7BDF3_9ASCO|nr:hypothetical protein C6P42_002590 [[Candida] californica]KAG0686806.1 hypothetical protein C6P40_003350 [[Candida] californica]